MATRAVPTTSAVAVAAVRERFRTALSCAILPGIPVDRDNQPNPYTVPGTNNTPSAKTPINDTAPAKIAGRICPLSAHRTSPVVPATNSTAPKIKRNLPALEPSVTAGTGRIASSGEPRIAGEAGNHEATTLITTPATSTQITEASIPKVAPAIQFRASASSPNIRPTAAKIPTTDPMSPISTDSANTALRIWPRVAPNTRCRAYCLVRWATKTENVLLMTNIITNKAIAEKPPKTTPMASKPKESTSSSEIWTSGVFTVAGIPA